jgi:hypothetical protein
MIRLTALDNLNPPLEARVSAMHHVAVTLLISDSAASQRIGSIGKRTITVIVEKEGCEGGS